MLFRSTIYQDNTSTITLVTTTTSGKMRNKHLRAQRAAVYEGHKNGDYFILYISTEEMVADILTKALEGIKFHKFAKTLLGHGIMRTKLAGVRLDSRDFKTSRACESGRACSCKK